jgi:hypothetical protein
VLLAQLHAADLHAAVDRLQHVVHREQRHAHRRQRLHLDPGHAHGFGGASAQHRRAVRLELELHRHPRKGNRVAQGDEFAGLLGRLDAGEAGDPEHVPLPDRAGADGAHRGGPHRDAAAGDADARGLGLGPDVDHVSRPGGVEVREPVPGHYSTVTDFARLRG